MDDGGSSSSSSSSSSSEEMAMRYFRRALEEDPDLHQAWSSLGHIEGE